VRDAADAGRPGELIAICTGTVGLANILGRGSCGVGESRNTGRIAEHDAHDPPDVLAGSPRVIVVQVAVLRDHDARSFRARITSKTHDGRRRVIATFGLLLATAMGGALWLGNRNASPPLVNSVAPERAPTMVGTAHRSQPACLSVTILVIRGRTQGDVNHQTRCGHDTGYPTPILRYVAGAWRPVLDALSYLCSTARPPARMRTQLDACLATRADRLALDR
jgi:hypothetical protein